MGGNQIIRRSSSPSHLSHFLPSNIIISFNQENMIAKVAFKGEIFILLTTFSELCIIICLLSFQQSSMQSLKRCEPFEKV